MATANANAKHTETKQPRRAPEQAEHVEHAQFHANPFNIPDPAAAWADLRGQFSNQFVLPSWSRGIITTAVVVLLGCGVAMAGSAIAAFFAAGAVSLGFSVFIQWLLTVVAWTVALYYGGGLMMRVGKYFLTAKVDEHLANARDGIAHAFTPNPKAAPLRAA